ncbi:MAG: hypothetical protein BZY88_14665 [SAR202 cluster bacterium Io17-Chloro-G9]|nr:MAG: hypothetical protein BZY88_14665 [SAR202 cluster bacterium Io17-Chloro-G9]
MPRYDYRCVDCEHEFELRQSFSEAGSGTCPQCSGAGRRVFHAVPVIYKGSGFYTTDYGRPKPPPENNSSKNGSDSSKDSSESKSTSESKSSTESSSSNSSGSDSSGSDTPAKSTSDSGSSST